MQKTIQQLFTIETVKTTRLQLTQEQINIIIEGLKALEKTYKQETNVYYQEIIKTRQDLEKYIHKSPLQQNFYND